MKNLVISFMPPFLYSLFLYILSSSMEHSIDLVILQSTSDSTSSTSTFRSTLPSLTFICIMRPRRHQELPNSSDHEDSEEFAEQSELDSLTPRSKKRAFALYIAAETTGRKTKWNQRCQWWNSGWNWVVKKKCTKIRKGSIRTLRRLRH